MLLRDIGASLAPALFAAIFGLAAHWVWGAPIATVVAASAGALVAGVVLPARGPRNAPNAARRAAEPERREREAAEPVAALPAGSGRLLLERLPLAVLTVDGEGRVQFANPITGDLFGRLPPRPFPVAALRAPKLLAAIEVARSAAQPVTVTFTLMRGSELHLRAHLRQLGTAGARGGLRDAVLLLIEDVTQTRRAQELYRDFVANASHELKTPLASISGIIETLQGHAKDDPEAAERFLGIMAVQADRMRRLINDMLSLNRIEQNERVPPRDPQPLDEIVAEIADAMAPLAEAAEISLDVALPAPEIEVLGSREELGQVFQNLIDNAIKYARAGDRVWVEILPPGEPKPGMIGICVADTGPGIARTHLPRLTERFFRVSAPRSRAKGGTGLGLAIVKHVLSRHRGALEIESEVGKGSRFTVWLPVVQTGPQAVDSGPV